MSTKVLGVTLQDHTLNADHLEKFHTHNCNTYTETMHCSIRISSAMVVNSTNHNTVGNFKLYVCQMTFAIPFVVALWSHTGFYRTSVSLL